MANAIFEKREFVKADGEIVSYPWYGIRGVDSNGEAMELPLKNLDAAEKIAFKIIASTEDMGDLKVITKKPNKNELPEISKSSDVVGQDADESDFLNED